MAETESAVTMSTTISELKSEMKRGPKLSRELRADYLLAQADLPPRKLRPEVVRKIQSEIARLQQYGDAKAREFARKMREQNPELLGEKT
jgi:predicted DNA-binding transcriptional regulator YafY